MRVRVPPCKIPSRLISNLALMGHAHTYGCSVTDSTIQLEVFYNLIEPHDGAFIEAPKEGGKVTELGVAGSCRPGAPLLLRVGLGGASKMSASSCACDRRTNGDKKTR